MFDNTNRKLFKMKKTSLIIILVLFVNASFSQYAVIDFFVLKDGMESQYLLTEKIWKNYHQSSVKKGEKIEWSLWKRAPRKNDNEMVPHYATLNRFASKEDMDNYINNNDNIVSLLIESNKGKMSSRQVNKVLNYNPVKEHRRYCIQLIDGTPFTGGDLKVGDIMEVSGMIQKDDEYENYETYVYKPIFLNEVMKGNMRWWGFTKVIDRNDKAYKDVTHFTWRIHTVGKKLNPNYNELFGSVFVSKKMRELTQDSRDVRGSGSLTMIDKTM